MANFIIDFFDLNRGIRKDWTEKQGLVRSEKTVDSKAGRTWAASKLDLKIDPELLKALEPKLLSGLDQLVMYIGVVIGIIFSTAVNQYQNGTFTSFSNVGIATIAISLVIGIVVAAQVYNSMKLDASKPFICRFGLFVQNGLFWSVILTGISKAAGAS